MYTVYRLIDPRDCSVGYVGITNDVVRRYRHHIITKSRKNKDKYQWVQELKGYNLVPELSVIETCSDIQEAKTREAYWIEQYMDLREPLTNCILPSRKGAKIDGIGYYRYPLE